MSTSDESTGERITDAEHAVMEVLWDRPRQTAAEVCEEVCAERDWSQADLAGHLDVSRQAVNAIETGKYDPSLPLAFRIARLFEHRIEEIFFPESE